MKIDGWEWRTLPEDKGRLERWDNAGGLWLCRPVGARLFVTDLGGALRAGGVVRPISERSVAFSWDEWMEATHPDPPEGYERRGVWTELTQAGKERKAMATTLLDDGRIIPEGWFSTHVGYACIVEQVTPPVTWADVPAGVTVVGWNVRLEGRSIGHIRWQQRGCDAFDEHDGGCVASGVSQPAAIVALIKAAGGEG